ncbi:hypothetical protein CGCSCA5_v011750 [Colletotrichum siamense]|nr:hypothetical protein CGCSCA5_v011750 [Colletotrichum siamense]
MRPAIEQMVRQFFCELDKDEKDIETVITFFSDDPTVIYGLREPGWIWAGLEEVKQCLGVWGEEKARTVPKIIVVDRGRVTCHVVAFEFETDNFDSFKEIQKIVIFDLDANNRIQRLEYRIIAGTNKERKGGRQVLDALITEIEGGAMVVDYLS